MSLLFPKGNLFIFAARPKVKKGKAEDAEVLLGNGFGFGFGFVRLDGIYPDPKGSEAFVA